MSDWSLLLENLRQVLIASGSDLPRAVGPSTPAVAHDVAATEQRLGTSLPATYREFLSASNGFSPISPFGRLLRVAEVDWLANARPDVIASWNRESSDVSHDAHRCYGDKQETYLFRSEYLHDCLQISEPLDEAFLLLNPSVRTNDGEWEAWELAPWHPGAARYPSFRAMMDAFLEHAQSDRRR